MKTALKILALVGAWLLGFWLFADSGSYACVMKASEERAVGCYTELEWILGYSAPTSWMRPAEFWTGILLFLGSLAAAVRSLVRWRRKKKKAPNQVPEPTSGLAPGRGSS